MSKNIDKAYLDKQEIYELACKYMRGLDRWDKELLGSVFHDDAYCEYGFHNSDAATFVDFCMEALGDHISNHHMIGQILIEVDGDEAFGEVYFNAYHKMKKEDGSFEEVVIAGRYIDRYEKREGIWKIAYRSEAVDFTRTQDCNEPYYDTPGGQACIRGKRQDDNVYDKERTRKRA